ncbi:GtrA family protein [Paraburkholderia phosphatilytica]|uniref:GtrA family protein n=1 Tax=Paraburkholderia phosphatilytica TaxID=2282883 RepID=UPI000E4B6B23|nr:GtrA family protein [Paraburkholderia phosphatilytica]
MSTPDHTVRHAGSRGLIGARAFRFVKYALMGLVGTGVQYAVLIALTTTHVASAVVASTIGAGIGAIANYVLNYTVTFKSNARHLHAAPRFFIVAAAGMAINALVMSVMVNRLHVYYLLSQVVATGAVLLFGFIVNSLWSFKTRHES